MPTNDREYQREYIRKYYEKSPLVMCECGGIFKMYYLYNHEKNSKKHYIYHNKVPTMEALTKEMNDLKSLELE